MESDHAKVTHATVQSCLLGQGMPPRSTKFVAAVLGAHHGRLKDTPRNTGLKSSGRLSEDRSGIPWEEARTEAAEHVKHAFHADWEDVCLDDTSPGLWWLAGLTTVADWIGSDERFFSSCPGQEELDRPESTRKALEEIRFNPVTIRKELGFSDLFGFPRGTMPNAMQEKAIATIRGPGVYVIEAPMGMGKTEAALWSAYHLLVAGKARGIYFALPTQATSNRIHLRMAGFVQKMAPGSVASRLIHANSWLMEDHLGFAPATTGNQIVQEDAQAGRSWFASAKRALLAPFGVGTIDQALLGVIAAKHFFVRQFALAGKVVILDEVHSYDLYTGTILNRLVDTLEGLGCTVIILSATLTGKRRAELVPLGAEEENPEPALLPYPLISVRQRDPNPPLRVSTPAPSSYQVAIQFLPQATALAEAMAMASRGGAVIWICNTVAGAQEIYRQVSALAQTRFPVGLLHSRFTFTRREELEKEWMERLGKGDAHRCGSILVATQIVEQSVDLDADLMFSELAPTDMLLQRMGRLWRHERQGRPACAHSPRFCILEEGQELAEFRTMAMQAIQKTLGPKGKVYAPFVLLRTLEVWKPLTTITLPDQIRVLIEATYAEQEDPPAWQALSDEGFGKDATKKFLAARNCNLWQPSLDDAEGVQTRLNEQPTLALVLCRAITKSSLHFLDGAQRPLDGTFDFATAQTVHRNLVQVPKYHFDAVDVFQGLSPYLQGDHALGLVDETGQVSVQGLRQNVRLRWSTQLGLVIEKHTSGGPQ